jgi:uncharacterized membrane protein
MDKESGFRVDSWLISLGLGIIGLVDSAYLTWVKFAGAYDSCVGIGRCDIVNQSRFAELWGQPVALFGALTYLGLVALLAGEKLRPNWSEWLQFAFFGVSLVGVLFSGYLTYIEVAVLHAICPYCVLSAVVITLMWLISLRRLLTAQAPQES